VKSEKSIYDFRTLKEKTIFEHGVRIQGYLKIVVTEKPLGPIVAILYLVTVEGTDNASRRSLRGKSNCNGDDSPNPMGTLAHVVPWISGGYRSEIYH
jgi:hypothetical protein